MCALLYLGIPVFNTIFPIIQSNSLDGAYKYAADVDFSADKWWNGDFQKGREKFLSDHFGFRPDYVRLHNQLNYTFFNKKNVIDVVDGTNECYFEVNYINSYNGKSAKSREEINQITRKIKILQDTLESKRKKFVFVIASGKGWFYPEFIPPLYRQTRNLTNYEQFIEAFKAQGVHFIDFNGWFVQQKGKTAYPLITLQGTHWSSYGATVIMDSLQNYLQGVYGKKLVDIGYTCQELTTYNKHDSEICNAQNFIFPLPCKEKTCSPQLSMDTLNAYKPTAIISGDSYFLEPYSQGIPHKIFKNHEFWYYNEERWNNKNEKIGHPKSVTADIINQTDLVIMMASEFQIGCLIDGFNYCFIENMK